MKQVSCGCVVAVAAYVICTPLLAQESTSATLAKELVAALASSKLDSIAAKDLASPDTYVAALYIPGIELLVVAAKYAVRAVLDARLAKKEYKEIYGDLSRRVGRSHEGVRRRSGCQRSEREAVREPAIRQFRVQRHADSLRRRLGQAEAFARGLSANLFGSGGQVYADAQGVDRANQKRGVEPSAAFDLL